MPYIKLDRDIVFNDVFSDNEVLAVYIKLLIRAKYFECVERGSVLKRGQLKISVRKFGEICNLSYQRTRRIISELEKAQLIGIKTDVSGSIITVFNYDCGGTPQIVSTQIPTQEKRIDQRANNAPFSLVTKENKEFCTKEAPAQENDFPVKLSRRELVSIYGENTVAEYERRFRKWKSNHQNVSVDCLDCIGKWMNKDGVPRLAEIAAKQSDFGGEQRNFSDLLAGEALGIYD